MIQRQDRDTIDDFVQHETFVHGYLLPRIGPDMDRREPVATVFACDQLHCIADELVRDWCKQ
jgi:hypothetical protein